MNQTEYAAWAGCTRPRVGQWIRMGMPASQGGFIDVHEADLWRERTLETAKRPDGPNAAARLRKLQAEAEIAEMKAAKLSGILQPVAEMESLVAALAISHRDFLFSFIARLAPLIAGRAWEQSELFLFLQNQVRDELSGRKTSIQMAQEAQDGHEGCRDSEEGPEAVTEPPNKLPPHDQSYLDWLAEEAA